MSFLNFSWHSSQRWHLEGQVLDCPNSSGHPSKLTPAPLNTMFSSSGEITNFLPIFLYLGSSIGKRNALLLCLQTQNQVFSMENDFSTRKNNCALASFSFELISWLKNTTTEKCKWVFLKLFEKYILLKYVLILKCTSTAAFKKWMESPTGTRVIPYGSRTGHIYRTSLSIPSANTLG